MTPRLLYLDNSLQGGVPEKLDGHFRAQGLGVEVFWAAGGNFPGDLAAYDAIFLSGSPPAPSDPLPWIAREIRLIRNAVASGIPILGECFGSQILAHTLCGADMVFRRRDFETGYVPIATSAAWTGDPLGRSMPGTFTMFTWHRDEVRASHPDMTVLGASPDCPNQIWRHNRYPVWGLQGHPEAGGDHAQDWFAAYRDDLIRSKAPLAQLHAGGFPRTPEALRIFANFAAVARERASR
ncbi:MAG: type 1 glutamine amidotransferase [Rhizomicrobium sp.]